MIHAIAHQPIRSAMMADATSSNPSSSSSSPTSLEHAFMQLLTTQLQNQSPLDPVDPSQFTTQLVQFNMLDQLAQINQTLTYAFGKVGH